MDWGSVIANIDLQGFAPRWLSLLVDTTLKVTLVLLVAGVVTFAMRAASAAARHAVWMIAFGGVLVLPLLSTLLPGVEVGFLPRVVEFRSASSEMGVTPPPAAAASQVREIRAPRGAPIPPRAPAVPRAASASSEIPVPAIAPAAPVPPVAPLPPRVPRATRAPHEGSLGVLAAGGTGGFGGTSLRLLVGIWLTGTAIVLSWLIIGLLRVDRVGRRSVRVSDADWRGLASRLRHALRVTRQVDLLVSPSVSMPMTWGIVKPVILLPASASAWSEQRKHDVLLHEMAHVQRYDFLTQLIARYACAMFWFNPVVWFAARQLRVEREQACDDVVLHAGSRPSTYAAHLLEIARRMKASPSTGFATVAMARRSQLAGRLLAVLDDTRRRGPLPGVASACAWLVGFLVFIPLASLRPAGAAAESIANVSLAAPEVPDSPMSGPLPSRAPLMTSMSPVSSPMPPMGLYQDRQAVAWASAPSCSEFRSDDRHGISENVNDDRRTTRFWDGDCEGEVSIRGEVRFDRGFTDVTSLSRDGRFTIEIDDGRETRRVELRSEDGLNRRWFVDGREQPYDAAAQFWFSAALRDFFRHSSLYVDDRVEWILQQGGVRALVQEAEVVHGQHLMRRLYAKAIESGQLSPREISGILETASRNLRSDFELARLLMVVPGPALRDETMRRAYIQASNTIESDFEKRRVLSAMLTQTDLEDTTVRLLLDSARDIDSDFELARLLIEIGPRYLTNDEVRTLFLQAAGTIGSDFERGRVLAALLEQDGLSSDVLLSVLQSAIGIQSDFELAKLLTRVAGRYLIDQPLRQAFFDATRTIGSDHEKQRVLKTLLEQRQFDVALLPEIIDAAQSISSDFALSSLLVEAVRARPIDEAVRQAYFRALATIESDFERQRALVALMERDQLSRDVVLDAVAAAGAIRSDHSKSVTLIAIAQKYRDDDTVREALMNAAESVGSSYEYGRVVSAIRGRVR